MSSWRCENLKFLSIEIHFSLNCSNSIWCAVISRVFQIRLFKKNWRQLKIRGQKSRLTFPWVDSLARSKIVQYFSIQNPVFLWKVAWVRIRIVAVVWRFWRKWKYVSIATFYVPQWSWTKILVLYLSLLLLQFKIEQQLNLSLFLSKMHIPNFNEYIQFFHLP